MEEFVNTNKLKGFIKSQVEKELRPIRKEINKIYQNISMVREEMIINAKQ